MGKQIRNIKILGMGSEKGLVQVVLISIAGISSPFASLSWTRAALQGIACKGVAIPQNIELFKIKII